MTSTATRRASRALQLTLLLDTHALLWLLAGDARVAGARPAIEDPWETVLLSAVCIWEAAIKSAVGKPAFPTTSPTASISSRW
jgi:PIN domain nuclease of toxin-antitoxin system